MIAVDVSADVKTRVSGTGRWRLLQLLQLTVVDWSRLEQNVSKRTLERTPKGCSSGGCLLKGGTTGATVKTLIL